MTRSSAKSWISPVAMAGYAAKGIVYVTVGYLAAKSAFGEGGKVTGSGGAVREIGSSSMGGPLLVLLGVGLLCYGIYRLLGACADIENEGTEEKAVAKRVGYLGSGFAYTGLALLAFDGYAAGAGGGGHEAMTAKALAVPFGRWLVGALGVAIIAAGIFQWVKAVKRKYASKFRLDGYPATKRKWIERIARIGLISRGIVLPLIGWFLIRAAMQGDSSETKGMGGALRTLADQPFGPWLLGITAIGLVCYGIYCWVLAIYGRWRKPA